MCFLSHEASGWLIILMVVDAYGAASENEVMSSSACVAEAEREMFFDVCLCV